MDPVLGSFLGLITLLQIATLTFLWQTSSRIDEVVAQFNRRIDEVVVQFNRRIDEVVVQFNRRIDEVAAELNLRIDKVVGQIHDTGRETNSKIDDLALRFGGAEQRIAHLEGGRTATNL